MISDSFVMMPECWDVFKKATLRVNYGYWAIEVFGPRLVACVSLASCEAFRPNAKPAFCVLNSELAL